ncbi:MAG: glycosyltransferase family 39 protein [Armatimonas sp.]
MPADSSRRRFLFVVGICVLLVIIRWLLRSHLLIDFDAVNYALGLESYDVRANQPHMPGYFLYIALGRLLLLVTGEANEALVLLSALFGAATLIPLWYCARLLFSERAAAWALLLGATSPLLWFQSSVASSRTSEGFFAVLVGWLCLILRRKPDSMALWWLAASLAVASGIRPQAALFLAPLAIWGAWRAPKLKLLGALALFGAGVACWAIPMLQAIGGIREYMQLNKAQSETFIVHDTGVPFATSPTDAIKRLAWNVGRVLLYTLFTLPALPLVIPALRRLLEKEHVAFLTLATAPSLAFFVVLHIQQPGHAMAYAPFLLLIVAGALARLPFFVGAVTLAVSMSAVLFLPARLTGDWFNLPTLSAVRSNDVYLTHMTTAIQKEGALENTLIVSVDAISRPMDYYLPRYSSLMLTIDDNTETPALKADAGRGRQWPLINPNSLNTPAQVRTLVVIGRDARIETDLAHRKLTITPRRYHMPWYIQVPQAASLETRPDGHVCIRAPYAMRLTLTGRTISVEKAS